MQVSVRPKDPKFLRFLWSTGYPEKYEYVRHVTGQNAGLNVLIMLFRPAPKTTHLATRLFSASFTKSSIWVTSTYLPTPSQKPSSTWNIYTMSYKKLVSTSLNGFLLMKRSWPPFQLNIKLYRQPTLRTPDDGLDSHSRVRSRSCRSHHETVKSHWCNTHFAILFNFTNKVGLSINYLPPTSRRWTLGDRTF